ncbi:Hypothetical protein TR210_1013 [Trichococcus ilyis]|uniref:Uncharacterized protein n=1 Tax=Trichococcus ilyis TaxID=640938 RepID=A0A143YLM6_9LACT|nr:Hypothetical protein TR210_1013 [Trichococcus ilyis]
MDATCGMGTRHNKKNTAFSFDALVILEVI